MENAVRKGRIQNFFQGSGRAPHFDIFPAELLRGKSRDKNSSRGARGMLPRNFFENLGSVIVILVLFVQFLRKILPKFFTPKFESFTKYDAMMHFVRTLFDLCLL